LIIVAYSRRPTSVRSRRYALGENKGVSSGPDPNLLQAFEHTLETLKRLSAVLHSTLDAMDRGERLSDATIAEYRAQLRTVDADRQRLEELLQMLWSDVEPQ
jgi:hypothetical protein